MNNFYNKTKQFSIAYLLMTIFIGTSCFSPVKAQQFPDAVSYLNFISNEYKLLSQDIWDYTKTASKGKSARKVEKRRKELITTTTRAKNKIQCMSTFNNDASLRDSIVKFLDISLILLKEDYAKIVDLEEIAEQSYDFMEAYLLAKEQANKKYDFAGSMVEEQYNTFAEANNITLLENQDKISQKLKISGRVIKYYNIIYLIHFKSFKQEAYLMEALSSKDINAIEQNRNALISDSEEGINKLKSIKAFEGDNSLIEATNTYLKDLISEAQNEVKQLANFNLEMEKFEKTKAAFDAIKKAKRKQEDVDNFNKAVNDINEAVNVYNNTQKEMNKKRGKSFDSWQKASNKFMDRHIP